MKDAFLDISEIIDLVVLEGEKSSSGSESTSEQSKEEQIKEIVKSWNL